MEEVTYKGNGYESVLCEHHRDMVSCPDCNIFKDGYSVYIEGGWKTKILHPFMWWGFKRQAKRIVKGARHD